MLLTEIQDTLEAEQLTGRNGHTSDITWAVAGDLMSDMLTNKNAPDILLTGLSNVHTIRTAAILGIKAIVIARNKQVDEKVIQVARDEDITVLCTPLSLFEVCGRLFEKGLRSVFRKAESV